MTQKVTGTVKWFNDEKGYGFITNQEGKDVFVHHTSIIMEGRRNLQDNQKVEFFEERGSKGLQAKEVVVVG